MPEKLRERIIETCGALTPEQQQLMIEFIWLRAHGPQQEGERTQKRLTELLDTSGVDGARITAALQEAVTELQRAMANAGENPDDDGAL